MNRVFKLLLETESSLRLLPHADQRRGMCAVCDTTVRLKMRDTSTGWLLGSCCVSHALFAQKALASVRGLRAPQELA
jgi:hypothetical protein